MTETTVQLTRDDLDAALNDERHMGYGYAGRRYLSRARREEMDRAVVRQANALGWTYEDLFEWANSKHGRWACDAATDSSKTATVVAILHVRLDGLR